MLSEYILQNKLTVKKWLLGVFKNALDYLIRHAGSTIF